MRKIRIAQIGVNYYSHSNQIYRSLQKQSNLFELVGCCLPENEREVMPDRVANLGEFPELTLEEILNDPTIEAVAIETSEGDLTRYALMAAAHGKHIHMEKPGGCDPVEFEALIDAMRESGKVFHVGYMYRYNPVIRDLMERVKNGELGDIISVEAQMSCYHPENVRRWISDMPSAMMFFLGCHLVDLVLQLQGDPDNIIPLNRHTGTDGIDVADFGMAVLEYKNGVSVIKTTDIERGGFLRRQLVVTGTKGTVELRPLERGPESALTTEQRVCMSEVWGDDGVRSVSEPFDRYDAMMASFAAMVRGEKVNPYTLDYELKLYKAMLRCCGVSV